MYLLFMIQNYNNITDISKLYNITKSNDPYKLPFLWALCNIIFPEFIHHSNIVTPENFRAGIPLTMIGLQLTNILYYKFSKKLFYTTIVLNVISLVAFGSYTMFYALPDIPSILESYYVLYLQNTDGYIGSLYEFNSPAMIGWKWRLSLV